MKKSTKKGSLQKFFKAHRKGLITTIVIGGIAAVLVIYLFTPLGKRFFTDGKTNKLSFDNIGELATQSVTCTSVRVEDKDRNLFGVSIPFTTSKVIYSYDTVIKAGFDFSEIKVQAGDTPDTEHNIYVKLPEAKILSKEVLHNSFKLYHEEESVFTPISLGEHNQSMVALEEEAEQDAIQNGLYENATENAKTILQAFIYQVYDKDEYKIVYSD